MSRLLSMIWFVQPLRKLKPLSNLVYVSVISTAQARDLIDEAGYSEYWRIRLGHFIGQEDHEYGDVSPTTRM